MSQYEDAIEKIKALKCPECGGSGKCDDADFGDISFNTWTCIQCDGTGMKPKPAISTNRKDKFISECCEEWPNCCCGD